MHQRFALGIKGLPIPVQIRGLGVVVKRQVPLELDRLRVTLVSGQMVMVVVSVALLPPRVRLLEYLHSLLVYLVAHHTGRLQAYFRPFGRQRGRMWRFRIVHQSLVFVQDANLLRCRLPTRVPVALRAAREIAATGPRQVIRRRRNGCRGVCGGGEKW